MILTPAEARKRLCCQRESLCEADHCMAWRQHFVIEPVPASHQWPVPMPPRPKPTDKGYCGLAYPAGG